MHRGSIRKLQRLQRPACETGLTQKIVWMLLHQKKKKSDYISKKAIVKIEHGHLDSFMNTTILYSNSVNSLHALALISKFQPLPFQTLDCSWQIFVLMYVF